MEHIQRRLGLISGHLSAESIQKLQIEDSNTSGTVEVHSEMEMLNAERRKVKFPVSSLSHIVYGNKQKFEYYLEAFKILQDNPIFSLKNIDDLSHEQLRELTMARIKVLIDMKLHERDQNLINTIGRVVYMLDPATSVRLGVHVGLFMGSISGNGTDYHIKKYYKPGVKGKIFGCFGMTELGHGSNAAGLETTATFDKKNQQFIINSPSLTAAKWWIGGAAETATHSVIFARLIIGEKDYGVHSFVVQLRDIKTHAPMPGVTIGDCGVKLGLNGIDNGYLLFKDVRIARIEMLDLYARVNEDGSYWKAGKSSLALQRLALVGARTGIVSQSALDGLQGLTIAIRYSAVRRQFSDGPGRPERAILDYQTQMYRLFVPLSQILASQFASISLGDSYNQLIQELQTGNTGNLNDVHAIAAGLKASASWITRDALIVCRDCLGGHGFSNYNRLARMIRDFQVQTTWDGDNTVLSQQTARYLINSIQKVFEGKKLKGSVKYLENTTAILSSQWSVSESRDLYDLQKLLDAFKWRTTNLCASTATRIQQEVAGGQDALGAWNACLVDLIALSKSHCDYYCLDSFVNAIEQNRKANPEVISLLTNLCALFALSTIDKDMGTFRDNDFVSADQARFVKQEIRTLYLAIRPYAVTIVDSFAIPDFVLDAQVGRYDGNIYEKYFERVQSAHSNPVPVYWEKSIKPLTSRYKDITK